MKEHRSQLIDINKCVDDFHGNKFEMIIAAAHRAREISTENYRNPVYKGSSVVTALLEFQKKYSNE